MVDIIVRPIEMILNKSKVGKDQSTFCDLFVLCLCVCVCVGGCVCENSFV